MKENPCSTRYAQPWHQLRGLTVPTTPNRHAGSSIAQLREQGGNGPFGEQTGAVVQALSEGMANAAQWSLVAATAFFALSLVGALRVLRAAGGEGERRESPANNADLGARVNRVPN